MSPFRLAKAYWPVSLPAVVLLVVSLPEKVVYGASSATQPHVHLDQLSSSDVPDAFSRLIFLVFADSSPQAVFLVGLSLALIVLSLLPLASALFAGRNTWLKRFTNLLKGGLHLLTGCSLFTIVVFSGANRWYVASAMDEILENSGLVRWQTISEGDSFGASGPVSKLLTVFRGSSQSFSFQSGESASAPDAVPLLQGATCGTISPEGAESTTPPADSRNSKLGSPLEVR